MFIETVTAFILQRTTGLLFSISMMAVFYRTLDFTSRICEKHAELKSSIKCRTNNNNSKTIQKTVQNIFKIYLKTIQKLFVRIYMLILISDTVSLSRLTNGLQSQRMFFALYETEKCKGAQQNGDKSAIKMVFYPPSKAMQGL